MCNSSKTASIETVDTKTDDITPTVNGIKATGFFAIEAGPQSDSPLPSKPSDIPPILAYIRTSEGPVTTLPLPHHVHDTVSGWHASRPKDSPTIMVSFSVDKQSYAELGLNQPRYAQSAHNPGRSSNKPAICDTGAQLTMVPHSLLANLKIKPDTIFPLETSMQGASEVPIMVDGGILLRITAFDTKTRTAKHSLQLAYVSRYVKVPYLSLSACVDLGLVPVNFPAVGSCDTPDMAHLCPVTNPMPQTCSNTGVPGLNETPCKCPHRTLPPTTPPHLPCAPTEENLPVLKQYILDRYSSSAFNCCEKQPLPLMDKSPPLRIFVDEKATPVAVHTPGQVPLH